MSEPRIIPALDALAEASQLVMMERQEDFPENGRILDAIDRQTAVLRMLVDVLERIDMPPGTGRSLPNVSVPPSQWLDSPP